jgi:hypothetical protein
MTNITISSLKLRYTKGRSIGKRCHLGKRFKRDEKLGKVGKDLNNSKPLINKWMQVQKKRLADSEVK